MPKLKKLVEDYKEKDLVLVSIHTADDADKMPDFVKKHDMKWPIAVDKDDITSKRYSVNGWPTYVLIDRKGIVREADFEPYDDSGRAEIDRLLAEKR